MTWLTPTDAASALNIKPRTLRERASAVPPRVIRRNGLYWIGDGEPTMTQPSLPVEHDDDDGRGPAYTYDDVEHRYIFHLKSKAKSGKPLVLPEDDVAAIVLAYSNDGSKATLNEIARTHGLHRTTVREILKALGKTHDSIPFTDEAIASRPEEELEEDLVRLKEERVSRKAELRVWNETKHLAEKARMFDKFVADRLKQVIETSGVPLLTASPKRAHVPVKARAAPFSVMATPTDLHYGKNGWVDEVGQEYNREICRERLLATADAMIERVLRLGTPNKWILGAGSDWFHIDTKTGTTTRGTAQDTDGTWARIFLEGSELACTYIERLRQVAPVLVVCMAGNHDQLASIMLTQWIGERYRLANDVCVVRTPSPRHYVEAGSTLVGITHGDGAPDSKLPNLMAAEAAQQWGRASHRVWFTGHKHTEQADEMFGTKVIHMPSLAGSDRWHNESGYVGNRKALSAYVIDHAEGLIASMSVLARGGK